MLNFSASQLTQIKLCNLASPYRPRRRRASSSSLYSPTKAFNESTRPSPLRRKSTRSSQIPENSGIRLQRLEAAIHACQSSSFFVLAAGVDVLYVSEVCIGQTPSFAPFTLTNRLRKLQLIVYCKQESSWFELHRSVLDLSSLTDSSLLTHLPENAVLVQFGSSSWYSSLVGPTQSYIKPKCVSYVFNQLVRLQSSTEFINDSSSAMQQLKVDLSQSFGQRNTHELSRDRVEQIAIRVSEMEDQALKLRKDISAMRRKVASLRDNLCMRRSLAQSSLAQAQHVRREARQGQHLQPRKVSALGVMPSELRRLQRHITKTLSLTFRLQITTDQCKVCGLPTSKRSEYNTDNAEEAAALGYIAHLVVLLAKYLDIPLRYPIRCAASSSYIIDPIGVLPDTSDYSGAGPPYSLKRDRRYPLHFVKASLERYKYGVFLLNKNIEQLLHGRGLVCGDIRDSLRNLDGLILWTSVINEDEDQDLSSEIPRNAACDSHEIRDIDDLLLVEAKTRLMNLNKADASEVDT